MPSRKKDRGRQRKAARQRSEPPPAKFDNPPESEQLFEEVKQAGCRITEGDDGSMIIRHPALDHTGEGSTLDDWRNFDRGLLTDEQRQELAENYVHNYAQDLREGGFHGTQVIANNIADPHIGPKLRQELLNADMHLPILHFLNQSSKSVPSILRDGYVVGVSIRMPFFWLALLQLLLNDGCSDEALFAMAKGIEPFVTSMVDDKRELFRSNHIWHLCLSSFFNLTRGVMMAKKGCLVMISYEGFIPFVAQASCWGQSREDIVAERELLRSQCPDPMITPEPIDSACLQAHQVLSVVLYQHRDGLEDTDDMNRALDQIACTPLFSNDPNCNDSTLAGLVRMMSTESNNKEALFGIIVPLLLKHGYVDARVIAELIEYGRRKSSMASAEAVLKTMVSILGRDEDNNHEQVQLIDSRYAAAVHHGLLEFGIDALIAYGDETGKGLHCIAYGLCLMAMHSKTSRALRGRASEIGKALSLLRKQKQSAPQLDKIYNLITGAVDASAPAICCNCLAEIDRKKLFFCQRCNVECYCSPACQSESFALGHDEFCKEQVQFVDSMREEGLSESELKRLAVLSGNLMMNGCRYVRRKMAEVLDPLEGETQQATEVTVHFGQVPPDIEVSRNDTSLKCTFTSPVFYGFIDRVNWDVSEDLFQETTVSRRYLAKSGSCEE